MSSQIVAIYLLIVSVGVNAQLYFPPNNTDTWEKIPIENLGWCQNKVDSLYRFLDDNNTKSFILLKDGKIVLERYFNGHSASSNWYWASAGKGLTAFLIGIAQQENKLKITDPTSHYLGQGWTGLTPEQEIKITIKDQLSMTSGLDDRVSDPFCTADSCLVYLAESGSRWAYHNAPYTLLDPLFEKATGLKLNFYIRQKLKNSMGMQGLYLKQGNNNVFFSNTRSMARFGLLMLNNGDWDGNAVMTDKVYFHQMINSSQELNPAYGYLWWLNGKESFKTPRTQKEFKGSICTNAPSDMYAAMGKNGQFLNVVPSQNLVWVRMGKSPDESFVPYKFNDDIWKLINRLDCNP